MFFGASEEFLPDEDLPSKSNYSYLLLIFPIIVIIYLIYYYVKPVSVSSFTSDNQDSLAHSLEQANWVLYMRKGCGYCTRQMDTLEGKYTKFIESDYSKKIIGGYTQYPPLSLQDPKITGFPFWYNTNTKEMKTGYQDLAALRKMI